MADRRRWTLRALEQARCMLSGTDECGRRVGASMFDRDVISFAHGEGIRRPYPEALRLACNCLHDLPRSPVENYMFLQSFPELESAISEEFAALGVAREMCGSVALEAGTTRLILAALSLLTSPGD